MRRNRAQISPGEIRFSHNYISFKFRDGTKIRNTLEQLKTGEITVRDIPKIKVVKRDGLLFSINNRRLWVFREYEEFLKRGGEALEIPILYGEYRDLKDFKLTTRNEGLSVTIGFKSSLSKNIKQIAASDIRYSSDDIYHNGSGKTQPKFLGIAEILDKLEDGSLSLNSLPTITVVRRGGLYYAIDHQRILWAIKAHAEKHPESVVMLECKIGRYSDLKPCFFTTKNQGTTVHIIQDVNLKGDVKRKRKKRIHDKCIYRDMNEFWEQFVKWKKRNVNEYRI